MSKAAASSPVRLFLGDPTVVDPLVHALVDERMGAASQSLDFEVLRHGERPLSEVEAALRQVGMFSRERCIWLRGFVEGKARAASKGSGSDDDDDSTGDEEEAGGGAAELLAMLEAGLPAGTLLVVSAASLDARGRLYKWLAKNADIVDRRVPLERGGKLGEEGLRKAVAARLRELGVVQPGPGVVDEIVRRSGNVLGETLQEIDRLVLAQADPTRLQADDVKQVMRDLALGWVFDLTRALEARDLAAAEALLGRLLAEGEAPLRLVAVLGSHFAELAAVRPLVDTLPKGALRMKGAAFLAGPAASLPEPYRNWKGYFRLLAASHFRLEDLRGLHREVLRLDLALKSSPVAPLLLFSRLLHRACLPASS